MWSKKYLVLFVMLSLVSIAQAASHTNKAAHAANTQQAASLKHSNSQAQWLIISGIGISQSIHSVTDGVSFNTGSNNINQLHQTSAQHSPQYMLGLLRQWHLSNGWISAIAIGPVLYYQSQQARGEVYLYQDPRFNFYNYNYHANVLNAYLEGEIYTKPFLHHKLQPYLLAGIGLSYLRLRYQEQATDDTPSPNTLFNQPQTTTRFAYELGAGASFVVSSHWQLDLRYVYQAMNTPTLQLDDQGSTLGAHLNSQSGLITLRYVIGE